MPRYSKEEATQALDRNPHLGGGIRTYFEAIRDGELPQYYRDEFNRLRHDYSDETPGVDVRTIIKDRERLTRYKCQGNYVLSLNLTLSGAVQDGVITQKGTVKEIDKFRGSDLNFQVGDRKNPDRIRRINKILDRVLGDLD